MGGPSDKTSNFIKVPGSWRQYDHNFILTDLYTSDELATIKVDAVVDDAFHQGWAVESSLTAEENERLIDFNDQFSIQSTVIDARKWSRLYGGGAVFIGSDDGRSQDQPLKLGGNIIFASAYERDELYPSRYYEDSLSPKFGQPSHYRLNPLTMGGNARPVDTDIHESRFLLFYGVRGTKQQRLQSYGWGQSVLLRPMQALKQFNAAYALTLSLLADSNQNVYKIKDFSEALRSGEAGEAITRRLEIIDKFRSGVNALVIDATDEDFVRSQLSLSGVNDILTAYKERLAAAFEMPLTRLLGVSPSGLNATGESDTRNWHKQVEGERKSVLKPALERWTSIVLAAKNGPTGGVVPDTFSVKFPSLWDLSPKEEAEIDAINATTDKTYRDLGILRKEHVASRFTGDRLRPTMSKEDIEALIAAEKIAAGSSGKAPELAPTDIAKIMLVREARQTQGLPPLGDERDDLTISQLEERMKSGGVPTAPIATPLLDGKADSVDSDISDEPDVDNDLMTFVAQMNEHRMERCPHGKVNRCRMCGIERIRELSMDPAGQPLTDEAGAAICNVKWRPLTA